MGGRRRPDAGVTLVEMLVVLALIGTVAAAVGLSLRPPSGADALEEAERLAARMRRATEEALLGAEPTAILWDEDGYRFVVLRDGGWVPHPVALLAEARALDGVRIAGEAGGFAVTAAALPADGAPLALRIGGGDPAADATVVWDGATATAARAEPDA